MLKSKLSFSFLIFSIFYLSFISGNDEKADPIIYVHLIPHSHDDVGWLKTVDQYFTGSN